MSSFQNIQPVVSPAHVPMQRKQRIPRQARLLFPGEDICKGRFCKLARRIIPEHWQRVRVVKRDGTSEMLCYHCMLALDGDSKHIMADNDVFGGLIQPEKYDCFPQSTEGSN